MKKMYPKMNDKPKRSMVLELHAEEDGVRYSATISVEFHEKTWRRTRKQKN